MRRSTSIEPGSVLLMASGVEPPSAFEGEWNHLSAAALSPSNSSMARPNSRVNRKTRSDSSGLSRPSAFLRWIVRVGMRRTSATVLA